jgi:hypothetical protein
MQAFFHYFVHAREDVRARFQITNPSSTIMHADPSFASGGDDGVGTDKANTTAKKKFGAKETPFQKQRRYLTTALNNAAAMNTKYIVRTLLTFWTCFLSPAVYLYV